MVWIHHLCTMVPPGSTEACSCYSSFLIICNIIWVDTFFLFKVHEAIAREESTEFKAGIVSHEVHRGFLLRERVLRPAAVKVSNGPGDQNVSSTSSEEPVEDTKEDAAVWIRQVKPGASIYQVVVAGAPLFGSSRCTVNMEQSHLWECTSMVICNFASILKNFTLVHSSWVLPREHWRF